MRRSLCPVRTDDDIDIGGTKLRKRRTKARRLFVHKEEKQQLAVQRLPGRCTAQCCRYQC